MYIHELNYNQSEQKVDNNQTVILLTLVKYFIKLLTNFEVCKQFFINTNARNQGYKMRQGIGQSQEKMTNDKLRLSILYKNTHFIPVLFYLYVVEININI